MTMMDSFMNLAKQGLQAYEQSQGGGGGQNQGRPQQQQEDGEQEFSTQPHGGQGGQPHPQIQHEDAIATAQEHAGSGDRDLFSQGLSFVQGKMASGNLSHDFDEEGVKNAHDQAYNQNNASSLSPSSMGAAAAMQAFRNFTSGGGSSSGGGDMQSKLMGMAMGEASKLFEASGGGGNKNEVVQGAAQMAMKLMMKSQLSGMMGGSNSMLGGMVNKFL
ncbi:hypothetical protein DL93DRAFT_2092757 [Clavulina sp. PMI_390]|nr:hypothetical protein DL93DRAFT_2092757 [Clavulina sp. PMI_390]